MRPLSKRDARRRQRDDERIRHLRVQLDQASNQDERNQLLRRLRNAEKGAVLARTYQWGIIIPALIFVGWPAGIAIFYRAADLHVVGLLWMLLYPIVIAAIWITLRRRGRAASSSKNEKIR